MKTKEFILSFIFIVITLIIYGLFPVKNPFQQFIVMATFFMIIPIIFNKFILKKKLVDIGVKIGNWRQGLIWSGISIFIITILFLLAGYFFNFFTKYSIPLFITESYVKFIFYEIILVAPVIFMRDFFFRGFTEFILESRIFYWSIIIQTLLYFILIWATNSLSPEIMVYLICAPFAGLVAYKSRSIFYSIIFQCIITIILDANIIRSIK